MPQITTTITLELEVTVECSFSAADPEVGIFSTIMEDFEIIEITGLTPVLQICSPARGSGAWDSTGSTKHMVSLQPWLQFSPKLEAEILRQTEDELRDFEID